MSSTQEEIDALNARIEKLRGVGRDFSREEEKVILLKRKLKKEENEIKPHPALQFGPIWQTVALMAALSLVAPLPPEAMAFYYLFSRITVSAVTCLVVHASIIYYGYNQALAKLPKPESLDAKLRKMMAAKPDRPDLWAHTRSHPSAFLTTRNAPPHLFPFPLGKSRPEATVKDEFWWEGGNAPHVGHFNKPKLPEPTGVDPETLMERFKESQALEKQQKTWKKRIRTIQHLCVVIIMSFVNRNIAIAALVWLIYNTVATELDNMLKPPDDMDGMYQAISAISNPPRNQSAPKAKAGQPVGGMAYIYDPASARSVQKNSDIPIVTVPPHVLMTSQNKYLAGPGEVIKAP